MTDVGKYWLELQININGRIILMDHRRFKLLRLVQEYGSMVKASKKAGIPYRTSQKYLEDMEKRLMAPVIKTRRGGAGGGGGSELTELGELVLREYSKINKVLKKHIDLNEIEGVVSEVDKEKRIIKVNFDGKEIIIPFNEYLEIGDNLLILISPDDIFVVLEPQDSSVRNFLQGKITKMELKDYMVRLTVDIDGLSVSTDITEYSKDELQLDLGKNVFIGFKAASMAVIKL